MTLGELPSQNLLSAFNAGAEARVARINSEGGLGGSGHPVSLSFCYTGGTQAGSDACARQAANNPAIVAEVGDLVLTDSTSILTAGGIADIPSYPAVIGQYTGSNVFLTNSGAFGGIAGAAIVAHKDLHAATVSLLIIPDGASTISSVLNVILQKNHLPAISKVVNVSVGATDVSPEIASAAQGVDAVVVVCTPAQAPQIALAAKELGIKIPLVYLDDEWTSQSIQEAKANIDGVSMVTSFPTPDVRSAGMSAYLADMKASGQTSQVGDSSLQSWMDVDLLNASTKGIADFTRQSILAALQKITDFTGEGITQPINFSGTAPFAPLSRVFSFTAFWAKVENGKLVSGGKSTVFPLLPTSNG
jgi:hypothetical protein